MASYRRDESVHLLSSVWGTVIARELLFTGVKIFFIFYFYSFDQMD
jgi:hypothetical protein